MFSPPSYVYPLRFQNHPQTRLWKGFLLCGNFSMTPSPGWVSIPKSLISVFIFYNLSYLLLKRLGCLSGCMVSSTSVQKLFCESCSTFKRSFDEFVGEKVVFPSYSSTILGPPSLSAFSKSSLNIWKFLVHVLLKPNLENFELYLLVSEMSAIVR